MDSKSAPAHVLLPVVFWSRSNQCFEIAARRNVRAYFYGMMIGRPVPVSNCTRKADEVLCGILLALEIDWDDDVCDGKDIFAV